LEFNEDGSICWQDWGNTWPEAMENRCTAREEALQANTQLHSEASSSSKPPPCRSERKNKGMPPKEFWKAGSAYTAFTGIPTTYNQGMKLLDSSKWIAAMQGEYQRMIDHKVWHELDPSEMPVNRTCFNAGWVYTTKNHADELLERFKARLVAKGYSQQAGIDYNEIFAPVTQYDSLRFIIALAPNLNLHLEQLEIKTAFLYGDLDKEIWMNPSPGIGLDGKVLRLRKALYGLKQAPLKLYEKPSSVFTKLGFSPSAFDPCVYISRSKQSFIVVYVDDITVAGTKSAIDNLVSGLNRKFSVSVKGPLSWIFGIKVQQTPDGIYLTQQQYIRQTLDRFGMLDSKSVLTPLDLKIQLRPAHPDQSPVRQTEYQSITGCINYLMSGTRPDLAHAYSVLSSFNFC
jgi:hypothetical protein